MNEIVSVISKIKTSRKMNCRPERVTSGGWKLTELLELSLLFELEEPLGSLLLFVLGELTVHELKLPGRDK